MLAVIVVGVLVAISVLTNVARTWTDYLFFDSMGFAGVFTTTLGAQWLLGLVGGGLLAVATYACLAIAYRTKPLLVPSPETLALERYHEAFGPLRRPVFVVVPLLVGLIGGFTMATEWKDYLLWRGGVPFGATDAQFGKDIGYFVFTLPWLGDVLDYLTGAFVTLAVVSAIAHYVAGGLAVGSRTRPTSQAARVHLSVILAALALTKGASAWFARYSLATQSGSPVAGVQYTDDHVMLPGRAIIAVATVICALFFLSVIVTRTWRLPVVGMVVLLVVALVVAVAVPALVQSIKVAPSEKSLQAPYIRNNIEATRAAYGLAGVQSSGYAATSQASQGQLHQDAATVPGIRIMDPNVIQDTFQQLEAVKNYYKFSDLLDVDQYQIDGAQADTLIAARELYLSGVPTQQRNWLNDHTVYTHGYGLVAAYGTKRDAEGRPVFISSAIPTPGSAPTPLGPYEPRIYYGEFGGQAPAYSIVGAPSGASPREFDYPDASAAGQQNTTYAGKGGVEIGSFAQRLAYAVSYRETNFLLSDAVNSSSRILDHRTPTERVQAVAPWLTLDGNIYPAVVDGRVQWIVDGYTTTNSYPGATHTTLGDATKDSLTATKSSVTAAQGGQVDYIRNAVKATVDAYDGTVSLYQWDESDPVLKAWMNVYPGVVKPMSAISGSLMAHLHYPEDLFKVQRDILTKYHVTDPDSWYGGQDYWRVPSDPTKPTLANVDQPPYYLSLATPGQSSASFSLTSTFMPVGNRETLSAFLSVDSYAGATAGQRDPSFGKLQLLEMGDANVRGPGQVQNDIQSSNTTSPAFSLPLSTYLNTQAQQGSKVAFGNLLTLPVGGGILNVEPIYVQGNGTASFPLLRAVVVSFGAKIAWSDTLDGALDQLFGGSSGAVADPTAPKPGTTAGTTANPSTPSATPSVGPSAGPSAGPTPGTSSGTPSAGSGSNPALSQAISDASQAMTDSDAAMKAGDWAAYGQAQQRLKDALARAAAAAQH